VNKTEDRYFYQAPTRKLLKACSELKSDKRAIFIDMTINELSPFDQPYTFLKKEYNALALRGGLGNRLSQMISPAFAKTWTDWTLAFDQIEGIDQHSVRLLIVAFLAKLFEQVRDEDYKKRKVSPRRKISPFRPAANNKYAL
jgi:hypothetical protein